MKIVYTALGISGALLISANVYTNRQVIVSLEHTRVEIGQIRNEVAQIKHELGSIVKTADKLVLSEKERICLVKNVYHEAGVEPLEGKLAVAQVTLERLESKRWGDSVCDVVYAKAQFSWTLFKKKLREIPKGELYAESKLAVKKLMAGYRVHGLEGAKFYHTDYIRTPYWVDAKQKIGQIGQHIFYTKARTR